MAKADRREVDHVALGGHDGPIGQPWGHLAPSGRTANGTVPPYTAFPMKTKAIAARPVPGSPVTAWQAVTNAMNVSEPRNPMPPR